MVRLISGSDAEIIKALKLANVPNAMPTARPMIKPHHVKLADRNTTRKRMCLARLSTIATTHLYHALRLFKTGA
jgi:hypothetical protein